jgi:putative acetyltransferase
MALTIQREAADSPQAIAMLKARDEAVGNLYPPEVEFRIPVDKHVSDRVLFFLVREGDAPIGCGALELHEGYGEMKSVFLMPSARGKRLGLVIVSKLEDVARSLGYDEVRLETGNRSPWAIRTYERAGYTRCARFGAYPDNAYSVFMMKRLPPENSAPDFTAASEAAQRPILQESIGGEQP